MVIGLVLVCASLQPLLAVDEVKFNLGRAEHNSFVADDVAVHLDYGSGESVSLHITAARLALPKDNEFQLTEIHCESGTLSGGVLQCENGRFSTHHKDHGKITGNIDMVYHLYGSQGKFVLPAIAINGSNFAAQAAFDADGWRAGVKGDRVDLAWLRKTLEPYGYWPADYSDESGSVDIDVQADGAGDDIHRLQGMLQAHNVGFYGENAAEEFTGKIRFNIDASDGWRILAEGDLDNGVLFVVPGITVSNIKPGITLDLTEQPLHFSFDTTLDAALEQITVRQLDVDHPGVMTASVQAYAAMADPVRIHTADITLSVGNTGRFYATWLQPFLLDTTFNAMEIAGGLQARLGVRDNEFHDLDLHFDDLHAYDGDGRFHIAGLDGSFRVNEEAAPVESALSWQGAGIYRLDTGGGKLALVSSNREVEITNWEDVPVLGGELRMNELNITNAGKRDMSIRLDGELTSIAMADFTRAMGWPIMSGELTGAIEGLTYKSGNLDVQGEINIGLFDGNIVIRNLSIDDLFGVVPVLHADIDINNLDLELLTNRFSFGYIQGRLGGRVHQLELQAWRPVYFEAELMTPENDNSRHRISQQAVENLGYLGGGSVNALSSGFLRVFKDYSYGLLGISCRLINGVCELGGVRDTENGFILVSRGGLLPPWIEVRGTGHSIAWPVLIEGLKTIATNKPEIR